MKNLSAFLNTPERVVIAVGLIIMGSEFLIMVLIESIHATILKDPFLQNLAFEYLDPIALTAIVSPALYFLVFQPLNQQAERRHEEQTLRQSEADIRMLVEHSPIAMLVAVSEDADEKIVMMNKKFTRLFGYTMEDVTDMRHWWLLAYPDEKYREELKAAWIGLVENTIQSHDDFVPMEATVTCKDGSSRYVMITLASVGIRNIITFEDITKRKQAEDSLRKLSQAVEQSPSSIIITDLDANIEYVNDAFLKITGYGREEIIGQNPRILQSGKTPKATYNDMWAHLTRGEVWKSELINRRKDGSEYIESVLISPVRQADGHVTNYLAIKEDVTERKQAESEIAEQLDELRRWSDVTSGREERILDLKHEVNELLGQSGQPPRYPSAESQDPMKE